MQESLGTDLLIVAGHVTFPKEWLGGLRIAARSDDMGGRCVGAGDWMGQTVVRTTRRAIRTLAYCAGASRLPGDAEPVATLRLDATLRSAAVGKQVVQGLESPTEAQQVAKSVGRLRRELLLGPIREVQIVDVVDHVLSPVGPYHLAREIHGDRRKK
jgi:hypothetical protein